MLVGPPGVGKTALAQVIAEEMAAEFHEILGQSIKNPGDLNAVLLAAKDKDLVHIDECHEMRKEFQTSLYRAIEGRKLFVQGRSSKVQSIPLNDFTLLLSTTDEFCLLQPLRDRMRMVLRFQFYEEEELAVLLRQRSRALNWAVEDAVFPLIAQRSRGTPRLSLRILQSARRVARSERRTDHHPGPSGAGLRARRHRRPGPGTDRAAVSSHPGRRGQQAQRHRQQARPAATDGQPGAQSHF